MDRLKPFTMKGFTILREAVHSWVAHRFAFAIFAETGHIMEPQLIPVNIVVADRTYRIKIRKDEEEDVRRVMKEVNEKIVEFKAAYAGKDIQDYIAMALIMYATHPATIGGKAQANVAPFLREKLQHLDNLLDEHLK